MQSESKAKIFALKSIMNNPKLSKILEEGFNAPIGSTKRVQAKSVVSILKRMGSPAATNGIDDFKMQAEKMKKAQNPYAEIYRKAFAGPSDGQGGPDVYNPYNLTNPYALGPQILKRAPAPAGNLDLGYSSAGSTMDSLYNPSSTVSNSTPSRVAEWTPSYPGEQRGLLPWLATSGVEKGILGTMNGIGQVGKYALAPVLGAGALGEYAATNLKAGLLVGKPVSFGDTAGSYFMNQLFPAGQNTPVTGTETTPPSTPPVAGTNVSAPQAGAIPGTYQAFPDGSYTYVQNDKTVYRGMIGDQFYKDNSLGGTTGTTKPTAGTDTGASDVNPLAGTAFESQWKTLPDSVKKSLLSSLTAGQFATITMADKEKLHALFPGVPDSQLPFGAGLQGQIDDLAARLKDEYNLNELANERNNLIKTGSTLSVDLTDYMRGRDTYIKSVNSMIEGVKNNMTTGLSDPASQAANGSYLDYLSVLKGRQNKRYIDLLNTSISRHDAQMTDITNEYNTKFADYKDALTSGVAITTDQYNKMYTDLSNMFTLVQNGPALANEAAQQQANIDLTRAQTIKELGSNTSSGGDFMTEAGKYADQFLDSSAANKGKFIPTIDLSGQITAALQSGKSPESLIYILNTGIDNTATSPAEVAKIKTMVDKFVSSGGDQLMTDAGYAGTPLSTQMYAKLKQASGSAYYPLISSSQDSVKSALDWLTNIDPKDLAGQEAKFYSKNSSVDASLLKAIWTYYLNAVQQNPAIAATKASRKSMFQMLSSNPGTDPAGALASQISY